MKRGVLVLCVWGHLHVICTDSRKHPPVLCFCEMLRPFLWGKLKHMAQQVGVLC